MSRFQSILVPTDFSPLAEAAALRAGIVADSEEASIHLLHAVRFPLIATPYEVSVPAAIWEGVRQGAQEKLERLRKSVEERTSCTVTAEVSDSSDPVQAAAQAVEARCADLVVMGTHGYGGIQHAFLGSVTERALRTLDRPILAVKEDLARAAQPISRILLAVDFSKDSDRALELATELAERFNAPLDVVHAFALPGDYSPYATGFGADLVDKLQAHAKERLETLQPRLSELAVPVTTTCRGGRASKVIVELANEKRPDLIVMGTRGLSGLSHVLLGSVAERTIRTAPCSVLAIKAETGEESQVEGDAR